MPGYMNTRERTVYEWREVCFGMSVRASCWLMVSARLVSKEVPRASLSSGGSPCSLVICGMSLFSYTLSGAASLFFRASLHAYMVADELAISPCHEVQTRQVCREEGYAAALKI